MKFAGAWPAGFLRYIECVETGETVLINNSRFIWDDRPCKLFGGELVFEGPEPEFERPPIGVWVEEAGSISADAWDKIGAFVRDRAKP